MAKKESVLPKLERDEIGLPIVHATLHQAISAGPKMGTEKSLHKGKIAGLKMWLIEEGLLVSAYNVVAVIPHANVAVAVHDDGKQ